MEWLRQLFAANQIVVYALYGQVFFTMGVALGVQSMKHTQLALGKHLRWLAAFGLSHGLVEWGYVFIPIQAATLPPGVVELLNWLQLALLVASFACLLQFGLRTALVRGNWRRPEAAWAITGMAIALAAGFGAPSEEAPELARIGLEIWTRYLLAVPGAALSAAGIFRAAADVRRMQLPRIAGWLRISGLSLVGYALLNLVTPEHHRLLAQWVNYATVLGLLGVPAQVLRTLVGLGTFYGMVRSLSVFEIETDRLLREAQSRKLLEAERELNWMNQVAITLGRARDPQQAMQAVLRQFLPLLRCTGGEIAVLAATGGWQVVAQAGEWTPDPAGHTMSPLITEVAGTGEPVARPLGPGLWGVGIPIHGGHALIAGAALVRPEPILITPPEMQVIGSFGNLLGVALENSRLWAEVQRKEADRTQWIGRVLSAQEDERRRIAHELHDVGIQTVVLILRRLDLIDRAVRTGADPAPLLAQARQQVLELIGTLRNCAHDLRPPGLDDLGVAAGLQRLLDELEERTGIRCKFTVVPAPRRLPRDMELTLYRIAQEALHNVENHAQARRVGVELHFYPHSVTLRVTDDGRGMAPEVQTGEPTVSRRLGIVGMQERAALVDGQLQIRSKPGQGTTVSVTIPAAAGATLVVAAAAGLPVDS